MPERFLVHNWIAAYTPQLAGFNAAATGYTYGTLCTWTLLRTLALYVEQLLP